MNTVLANVYRLNGEQVYYWEAFEAFADLFVDANIARFAWGAAHDNKPDPFVQYCMDTIGLTIKEG